MALFKLVFLSVKINRRITILSDIKYVLSHIRLLMDKDRKPCLATQQGNSMKTDILCFEM